MKKIIFILAMLFCPNLFAATLTTNKLPYTCQGGSSPQLCDSNLTTSNGNVGIGTAVPSYAFDVNGTIGSSSGDLASVAWQNYSSSTISGWSSLSVNKIYYKKFGKFCYVKYDLEGVSNATTASFTVPYASSSDGTSGLPFLAGETANNSVYTVAPAELLMFDGTTIVYSFKDSSEAPWTASNNKAIIGEFFYQTQ